MKPRQKPQKRERRKVDRYAVHRDRTQPGRVFRLRPDPGMPHIVELRLARDRRRMFQSMIFHDGAGGSDPEVMGLVRSWWGRRTRRAGISIRRLLVARIYLNRRDLREHSGMEIITHECTHAGLAWARFRRANLGRMAGEEVACYASGRLARQVNNACQAMGVWT